MNKTLEYYLEKYTGHNEFRTGQKEIITDVLEGKSCLGILPTGSGKSLCYQLPARVLNGLVVVVSPLISLMIDQVKQLKAEGFREAVALNSFLDYTEKQQVYHNLDQYKLVYVSPEMLQNPYFLQRLRKQSISLFVVDEAHCISQWGHEFRPDYLKLDTVIQDIGNPPVLALSATATPDVQKDIIKQLNCEQMVKHIHPMDRDNIAFVVKTVESDKYKLDYIAALLHSYQVPTMIYFSSRKWTEQAAEILRTHVPNLRIAFYHGGMEQTDRILIQQQFMNDQLDVICCTSAFGMGINKKNVRLVVHYHLPTQVESFIQEVGRAGRDGEASVNLLLSNENDQLLPKQLIETELPTHGQITMLMDYLRHLVESKELTIDESLVSTQFQFNETQWRFLKYQLEVHGMIKEDRLVQISSSDRKAIVNDIHLLVDKRKKLKLAKLTDLINWIHDKGCRRERLFLPFQEQVRPAKFQCCDHCGFSFEEWNPTITNKRITSDNWEDMLQSLFFQGEHHEKQTS
ncbi:ATP-dependent DNA helicase [Aquibacillus koreensis]|uniref:ATP-dependent DNA helicase n=1 Tax=Aquibacillus koreensis TaxID=279446 RepID=A0A9X3WFI3_9BACI|nr:ATP-dependent DNA helicase RecQ [Aquibacillus koreensis]MCT2537416.1 ATP-dependent DNA helicase [Aquibacillus koreensis]MDC3418862.1 ATP-dependent DNA helicase [Aquibacillus koreensis]